MKPSEGICESVAVEIRLLMKLSPWDQNQLDSQAGSAASQSLSLSLSLYHTYLSSSLPRSRRFDRAFCLSSDASSWSSWRLQGSGLLDSLRRSFLSSHSTLTLRRRQRGSLCSFQSTKPARLLPEVRAIRGQKSPRTRFRFIRAGFRTRAYSATNVGENLRHTDQLGLFDVLFTIEKSKRPCGCGDARRRMDASLGLFAVLSRSVI